MKRHKLFATALIMATMSISFGSCDLDETPESFISPDQMGDSKEAADQWVTGVYSKWINNIFCYDELPRYLEIDADYVAGPDWLFKYMGSGNFQAELYLDKMWSGPYNLIMRGNVARRYLAQMTIDEEYKNNCIGEVEFNQAMAYFLLVRAYGGVPVIDNAVDDGGDFQNPRQSVDSVYNKIIELLTDAQEKMYHIDDTRFTRGHVSAGSAAGLLAKVYATMAAAAKPAGTEVIVRTGPAYDPNGSLDANGEVNYTDLQTMTFKKRAVAGYEEMNSDELYRKASYWAKKVIDGEYGDYQLLAYDELWKKAHNNDPEFMFSVGAVNGDATYKNGIHTYYEGYTNGQTEFIQSGGWIGCTDHWYKLFDKDDYRITEGVKLRWRYYYHEEKNMGFYYPYTEQQCIKATGYDFSGNKVGNGRPKAPYNDGVTYYYSKVNGQCLAFTTKYSDVTDESTGFADAQWPFLRYADVMLIYAEAQNELGNQDEAMKYLNKIRKRSNATLMTVPGNQVQMRSVILEERAKELACEGDRRWDIIRWGIYLDCMNAVGHDDANNVKSRTERNLLYPIPVDEVNTNKFIEQNPGWQ
ncbi:MAG: RagB/SusD family nutrient uptake outer membrane protein [Prevotella sp.]